MDQRRKFAISTPVTCVAVAVSVLAWVAYFGPSWPYRDSFAYLFILERVRGGHYSMVEFLRLRNNEHFVAFQYFVAAISLWISGFRTKVLLFESAILLLTAGVLILLTLQRSAVAKRFPILLPVAVMLSLLNLSQIGYLLWEFQIFWYIDFAFFAVSIYLIERFRLAAYPAVLLLCILSTGSEAQGAFLWISSGIHFLLLGKCDTDGRRWMRLERIVFCFHSLIFLAIALLLLNGSDSNRIIAPNIEPLAHRLVDHSIYYLKVLGGGFGLHNEKYALLLGAISLTAWLAQLRHSLLQTTLKPEDRVALLLSGTSMLWIAAFAVGREKYGAQWALGDFHASPMIVPFYMGIAIYALVALSACVRRASKALAVSAFAFALAPIATAYAYGYAYSSDARLTSMLAASASCDRGSYSHYLLLQLNGLPSQDPLYTVTIPDTDQMCAAQSFSKEAARLLAMPRQFQEIQSIDARDRYALRVLWDVYLTHADLRRTIKPSDPDLAKELLTFAYFDAKSGSLYEPGTLKRYSDVFLKLQGG